MYCIPSLRYPPLRVGMGMGCMMGVHGGSGGGGGGGIESIDILIQELILEHKTLESEVEVWKSSCPLLFSLLSSLVLYL